MGQKRFHPRIAGGIIVGYIGFLLLVIALISGSWFVRIPRPSALVQNPRHNSLFSKSTKVARACQTVMLISFITNLIACLVGMTSSYAVTRPRMAGFAAKRLRLNSESLNKGPNLSGWLYITSGCFTLIAAAVATSYGDGYTGYSVVLAWVSVPLCVIAGALLIFATPPKVPFIADEENPPEGDTDKENGTDNEKLPVDNKENPTTEALLTEENAHT